MENNLRISSIKVEPWCPPRYILKWLWTPCVHEMRFLITLHSALGHVSYSTYYMPYLSAPHFTPINPNFRLLHSRVIRLFSPPPHPLTPLNVDLHPSPPYTPGPGPQVQLLRRRPPAAAPGALGLGPGPRDIGRSGVQVHIFYGIGGWWGSWDIGEGEG